MTSLPVPPTQTRRERGKEAPVGSSATGNARPAVPHPGGDPNPSHREREEDREREQGEPPGSDQTPDTVGLVAVARCRGRRLQSATLVAATRTTCSKARVRALEIRIPPNQL